MKLSLTLVELKCEKVNVPLHEIYEEIMKNFTNFLHTGHYSSFLLCKLPKNVLRICEEYIIVSTYFE